MWDGVVLTEFDHLADAAHRKPRFYRARLVINARVEHAAVIAGLMTTDTIFFFKNRDFRIRKAFPEPVGRGKPDDATAYNHKCFRIQSFILVVR
jgi:hypothetical protein